MQYEIKSAFLPLEAGVELSIHFQKRLGTKNSN